MLLLVQLPFHSKLYPLLRLSRSVWLVHLMHHLLLRELIVAQETASSDPTGDICGSNFNKQDVGQMSFDVPSQVHPVCVGRLVQDPYGIRGHKQDLSQGIFRIWNKTFRPLDRAYILYRLTWNPTIPLIHRATLLTCICTLFTSLTVW